MRKTVIFLAVALLLAFCAAPIYADALPPLPHSFCGNVTISGSPAPVGTTVEARGQGVITGVEGNPIIVTEVGKYGSPEPLGQKLIVKGDIADGTKISFLVNGIYTDTTCDFKSGETTVLDLNLVITASSITGEVEETIPSGQIGYVVDASDMANTTITVDTIGVVTITVQKYNSNPEPGVSLPASMLPSYIDIKIDNPDAIVWPMHVEQTYTDAEVTSIDEASLGMYYFKDGAWHRCSDTGVDTAANYIWANMIRDELSGSPVAIGGTPAPTPTPPAIGGGGGPLTVETSFFGAVGSININSTGIIQETFTATSPDGKLTITIPKGTKALDKNGNPLTSLTGIISSNPPAPPKNANVIGLAYDFGPTGATFDPPITFTWKYDQAALPIGIAEEDLTVAYYDTTAGKWVELTGLVDTTNNKITASVSHYTTFAMIGTLKPAAFTLSSLVISPVQVAPSEKVDINLSVANTGGMEGSYTVALNINGVREAERSVTVAAGSIQTITFSVTKTEAGSYSVTVDGLSGSFTVVAPTTTPPTTTPPTTTPPTTTPTTTTPPTTTLPTTTPPVTTPPVTTAPPTSYITWYIVGAVVVVIAIIVIIFLVRRRHD